MQAAPGAHNPERIPSDAGRPRDLSTDGLAGLEGQRERVRQLLDSLLGARGSTSPPASDVLAGIRHALERGGPGPELSRLMLNHVRQTMPGTSGAVVTFLPELLEMCASRDPAFFATVLDEMVPRLGSWPRLQMQVGTASAAAYVEKHAENFQLLNSLVENQLAQHRYRILDTIGFLTHFALATRGTPDGTVIAEDVRRLLGKVFVSPSASCASHLLAKDGLRRIETEGITYKRLSTWDFPDSSIFVTVDRENCTLSASNRGSYASLSKQIDEFIPSEVRSGAKVLREFPELAARRADLVAASCVRDFEWEEVSFSRIDRAVDRVTRYERSLVPLTFMQSDSYDRHIVEEFGLRARGVTMADRFYMFSLLAALPSTELPRVKNFFRAHGEAGVRSLFALEYETSSPDFLLAISEGTGSAQAHPLFQSFSKFVEGAKHFRSVLLTHPAFDTLETVTRRSLADEVYEGFVRRGRDVMAAAAQLAVNPRHDMKFGDCEQALRAVSIFFAAFSPGAQAAMKISPAGSAAADSGTEQVFKFDLTDLQSGHDFKFKAFTRPAHSENGEARVNMELNFDTPNPDADLKDAFTSTFKVRRAEREYSVSSLRVALDLDLREGREHISLDIGRSAFVSKRLLAKMQWRTADSLGKLLALVNANGSHTPESFDAVLARPEQFRSIVNGFQRYFAALGTKENRAISEPSAQDTGRSRSEAL